MQQHKDREYEHRDREESPRCSTSIWADRLKSLAHGPRSSPKNLHLKPDMTLCLNNYFGDYFKFTWPWDFAIIKMANLFLIDCVQ